jgi:hypothetical protein
MCSMIGTCVRLAESLATAKSFQALACLRVEPVAHAARRCFAVPRGGEVAEERPRGELSHLLARCAAYRRVRGDEADELRRAMLSCKALDQGVRVRRESDLERAERAIVAAAVEDDDAASALGRHKARERVGQLTGVRVVSRVEQVVAVEEVERGISDDVRLKPEVRLQPDVTLSPLPPRFVE